MDRREAGKVLQPQTTGQAGTVHCQHWAEVHSMPFSGVAPIGTGTISVRGPKAAMIYNPITPTFRLLVLNRYI